MNKKRVVALVTDMDQATGECDWERAGSRRKRFETLSGGALPICARALPRSFMGWMFLSRESASAPFRKEDAWPPR